MCDTKFHVVLCPSAPDPGDANVMATGVINNEMSTTNATVTVRCKLSKIKSAQSDFRMAQQDNTIHDLSSDRI